MEQQAQGSSANVKDAKRVFTLEDVKFNEANKVMAILSCIPLIGLVMLFVEKKDQFVRYHAAQYAVLNVLILTPVLGIIPVINIIAACAVPILGLASFVLVVMGMIKISQGQRFDAPLLSGLGLKLMNAVQ